MRAFVASLSLNYLAETRFASMDWLTGLSIERVAQLWSFARAGARQSQV